jgi:hypothetical protein
VSETHSPKVCAVCGRLFAWRRKWARDWESVRYCSDACRRRKRFGAEGEVGRALEDAIASLLAERKAGGSICPSEAARRVAGEDAGEQAWRDLMEPARGAARRMAYEGRIEITQKGRKVEPTEARGPIRLRRSS